jgi:hypothetical protein
VINWICAGMAELADAHGLGPCAERRAGSSPVPRTKHFRGPEMKFALRVCCICLQGKSKPPGITGNAMKIVVSGKPRSMPEGSA